MIETLHALVISFVIGLLIGIERERSHREDEKALGVRTFILIAMLGLSRGRFAALTSSCLLLMLATGAVMFLFRM